MEYEVKYETISQAWILQCRTGAEFAWDDYQVVNDAPLLKLQQAKDRTTTPMQWRLIRRTEEEVIVPDGQ